MNLPLDNVRYVRYGYTMKWIRIDIPDELHRALRVLAANRGTTVKALVIEALEQVVNDDTKEQS